MNNYAMIFAAGLGTRLGEISEHTPKALVEIARKPLLHHVLLKLQKEQFTHVVVNVHHHADQIISFLSTIQFENMKLYISDESDLLLDTGGGLKNAAGLFFDAEHILLHNVDVISDINLKALYRHHCNSSNLASLAVKQRHSSRYLLFDRNNHLKGWKGPDSEIRHSEEELYPLAFSGIHVVSAQIFSLMPQTQVFSMTNLYLELCGHHTIEAWPHHEDEWVDVGKPEHLEKAEQIIVKIQSET